MKKSLLPAASVPRIFTSRDLELKFNSVLYGWYRRFPEEAERHLRHVKEIRDTLHDPRGLSKERLMLIKASLPARVLYALGPSNKHLHHLPKNWFDDPKFCVPFLGCLEAFCINTTSVPRFDTVQDRKNLEDDFPHAVAAAEGINCA